jgi:electron transfer flavoprotein alpha subunit
VFLYEEPELADFRDDPYTDLLAKCCEEEKPSIFLIGATSLGRSLGPRVAAKLHTGLTADCTYLDIDPETGLLRQTRPAYGGNIMATIITPRSRPQMATVRYKMFPEAGKVDDPKGSVVRKPVDMSDVRDRVKVLGFEEAKEEVSISEADLIVSGGLGMGAPEGFELIRELADTLGAAVGASRPTVDEGWIDYRPGGSERQDRAPPGLHGVRHQRRRTAPGWHEDERRHNLDKQGPGGTHLQDLKPRGGRGSV